MKNDWMETLDAHLKRYIVNRNKRTGQTWRVVERYATWGDGRRCAVDADNAWWQRAVIENEHGKRVRIYHRWTCWCVA
jgi:hypothetical protein